MRLRCTHSFGDRDTKMHATTRPMGSYKFLMAWGRTLFVSVKIVRNDMCCAPCAVRYTYGIWCRIQCDFWYIYDILSTYLLVVCLMQMYLEMWSVLLPQDQWLNFDFSLCLCGVCLCAVCFVSAFSTFWWSGFTLFYLNFSVLVLFGFVCSLLILPTTVVLFYFLVHFMYSIYIGGYTMSAPLCLHNRIIHFSKMFGMIYQLGVLQLYVCYVRLGHRCIGWIMNIHCMYHIHRQTYRIRSCDDGKNGKYNKNRVKYLKY